MRSYQLALICVAVLLEARMTAGVAWDSVQCSKDPDQNTPDGLVSDIGRFPWLGVVQHSFYLAGAMRFAITSAILIHPTYIIAPAEDMARINRDQMKNTTKFIIWHSKAVKYAMDVLDYILHPEYEDKGVLATVALLELESHGETTIGENKDAVLPVCLPISGSSSFNEMYAVKMTDGQGDLQKEVFRMQYVNDKDCREFYVKNGLTYAKMAPVAALCASTARPSPPCVWDGGVALITRESWGLWKILGYSVRGPGCGAPARFLVLHDYVQWVDDLITEPELEDEEGEEAQYVIGFRRLSPIKLVFYRLKDVIQNEFGKCDRKARGNTLYKESMELLATKDFAQGFYYVIITQIAQFRCAIVNFERVSHKTNMALWIEHNCYRGMSGLDSKQTRMLDNTKRSCFMYFKTAAFVKFRFFFSFKAILEVTLYGTLELPVVLPDPFKVSQHTTSWWPTEGGLKWSLFELTSWVFYTP